MYTVHIYDALYKSTHYIKGSTFAKFLILLRFFAHQFKDREVMCFWCIISKIVRQRDYFVVVSSDLLLFLNNNTVF